MDACLGHQAAVAVTRRGVHAAAAGTLHVRPTCARW